MRALTAAPYPTWQVDGSGRQWWRMEPIQGMPPCFFHIKVAGGTEPGKEFLSVNDSGEAVDLYSHDDGSGRQQWILMPM